MSFWFAVPGSRDAFRDSHGFPRPFVEILEGEEAIEALAPIVRRLGLPERSSITEIWDATYRRCHWERVDLDLALARVVGDGDVLLYDGFTILRMVTRDVLRALPHLRIGDCGPDLLIGGDGSWMLFVNYEGRGIGFVFRRIGA
jgi:hypothetical protein